MPHIQVIYELQLDELLADSHDLKGRVEVLNQYSINSVLEGHNLRDIDIL